MSDIKITLPCAFTFSNIVVKIISLSISIVTIPNIMFVRNSGSGNNGENALWKVFYYIKK